MDSMSERILDAIILGAGFGGLGAAAQLKRNNIDNFLILEKKDHIGGVWRDNTYPGAACDTQSVIYCYSYFLNLRVSRMYADGSELLGYLESLADEFDVRGNIRFESLVSSATWQEERHVWRVETADHQVFYAKVFIPAWGQLSEPSTPTFTDAHLFRGVSFHSAEWDHDVDLTGLRVGSIGSAASAVQYVPEVAKVAQHLSVFQRSANYILPRNQIVFSEEELDRFQRHPESFERIRGEIHGQREAGFTRTKHLSADQNEGALEARAHLEAQVSDPQLRRSLTPTFEFGCKRILRSDAYYPALSQANVSLETSSVDRFTESGIVTGDGVHHELDVIIYGTGFKSQAFQGDLVVTGRDGVTLDQRWGDSPEAYLGMAVDGFPNMFMVYGPNTNLNHNSIVTMLEAQHEYIVQVITHLRDDEDHVFDVRLNVLREFNDMVQQELEGSAYSSDCSSWYKNAAGKVINNWCGTVDEYRTMTNEFDLADYAAVK